ncbi:site-specific integrase [Bacillus paralicheniformis]|uniref:site-specific integrase n=1 Tax=Bacillus paralicheniformis TaxID=1648923 RepID=UPI000C78A99E|nr:site-specific integrase [Bacillus paralicheniformis]PLC16902.1 site-specific integrase [Bacillus paralicheniformis]
MASFRKHGNGSWEYRIRYKDPIDKKFKEKSKRGFNTKKEAQLAAAEEEKKVFNGFELDDHPYSLKNYLHEWLKEYKSGVVRKNTFELHKRNVNNHIIPHFKNIDIKEVKPILYQKFINSLCNKNYSKRTVEIIHSTMSNAMEKAVLLGKIEKNPCVGIEIKTNKKREYNIEFINSDDLPLFLRTAYQYGYIYYIFFKTLLNTGMRKGEAAALQWTDIDFKNKTINISKTLDFRAKNQNELFGDPKTFTSKRIITIDQQLVNDLHDLKKRQNDDKLVLNEVYLHELNLVFARKDGSPLPKSSLFNAFDRILKKAGLPKLPIHALRDTHAVLLLESGASMKYVQERLGHKSIQVTSDIYSHVSKKIDMDSMNRYEEYISTIME